MGQQQTRAQDEGIVEFNPFWNPIPVDLDPPVRDIRPPRFYNRAQKLRAVSLLNRGMPCHQVARMIGPRCSAGTTIRWRQQARRQAEGRRREAESRRQQDVIRIRQAEILQRRADWLRRQDEARRRQDEFHRLQAEAQQRHEILWVFGAARQH